MNITRGCKATPSAEIHSIIEVQVRGHLTGTALGSVCEEPMTSPLIPWPSIIPPSSALYLRRGGIQVTVPYNLKKRLRFSGVAAFIRCQSVRRPNFVLISGWRLMKWVNHFFQGVSLASSRLTTILARGLEHNRGLPDGKSSVQDHLLEILKSAFGPHVLIDVVGHQ